MSGAHHTVFRHSSCDVHWSVVSADSNSLHWGSDLAAQEYQPQDSILAFSSNILQEFHQQCQCNHGRWRVTLLNYSG